MSKIDEAIAKITEQQKSENKYTNTYQLGEHLKDICRESEKAAELVCTDLDNPDMSIQNLEKKIKARCDAIHREIGGNGVALPMDEAESIIRDFYGLGAAEQEQKQSTNMINLADYM